MAAATDCRIRWWTIPLRNKSNSSCPRVISPALSTLTFRNSFKPISNPIRKSQPSIVFSLSKRPLMIVITSMWAAVSYRFVATMARRRNLRPVRWLSTIMSRDQSIRIESLSKETIPKNIVENQLKCKISPNSKCLNPTTTNTNTHRPPSKKTSPNTRSQEPE